MVFARMAETQHIRTLHRQLANALASPITYARTVLDLDPFDSDEVDQAPICASCGVTMLPADAFGPDFSCQNDDCDAFGND